MFLSNQRYASQSPDQVRSIGERLANTERWKPYCEGLKGMDKGFTAILLENLHQFISNMDETTRVMQIGNFDKFAYPIVRAVYPNLIASEIVSVQAMQGPVSLIFYLDFIYGSNKGSILEGDTAFDALRGPNPEYNYSSELVDTEFLENGTGGKTVFNFTTGYSPVRPTTFSVSAGTVIGYDNGTTGTIAGTGIASGTLTYQSGVGTVTFSVAPALGVPVTVTYRYDSEANDNIPSMDLQLTSAPVTARPRKFRTRWSLEAAQNLNALHGLDAQTELVGAMSEQMQWEIDREIINDLYRGAIAGHVAWTSTVPFGVSYTEHKLSIIDTFTEGSNLIYQATGRGQANWIVMSVAVANVVETLPMFEPESNAYNTQSQTGVVRIGKLAGRWTCYKDPYLGQGEPNPKVFVMGYKGGNFLEAGYVYSPYIPVYTTPTVVLDDFIGRKGLATQYGKKFVNPRFYVTGSIIP